MTDIAIGDETLEEWFAAAATEYEVPAGGIDAVLAAAGERVEPRRARFQHPRLAAAAVLVIAAVSGAALWGSATSGRQGSSATSASGKVDLQSANGRARLTNDYAGAVPQDAGTPSSGTQEFSAATGPHGLARSTAVPATPADGAKIVHVGSLSLSVAKGNVSAVLTQLTGLADGVQGYVASTTTTETGSRPTGTVVLRVPAASYDQVLRQARDLGTVVSTSSSGKDVTGQVADQQAQLKALQATRAQFLTILAKTTTIGETLAVQEQVNQTQQQIDELQGQIKVLDDQASYGTLTVTVNQKAAVVVPPQPVKPQSGLSKAWHSAKDGFVTGVESLIAHSGRALVVLLVLLAGLAVVRVGWRVARRRLV